MQRKPRKVLISCGPIPAKLDSVKFVTNKFKGGLAFKTATILAKRGFDVTALCWDATPIPDNVKTLCHVETVSDVADYCNRIKEHAVNKDFNAYIMAGAVANLMPASPWEGKFPSHNYSVGEKFDIAFEIAPRAIDIVKAIDSHVTLIGYKLFDGTEEELVEAARITQRESHADVIFANHPKTAKERKIAITPDNSVIPMTFDEHIDMITRAITAMHYRTEIVNIEETEDIKAARNIVNLYETTFDNYGTVAIPVSVDGYPRAFATTSRGHTGDPVIVLKVDHSNRIVYATSKATLNAPTLDVAFKPDRKHIVIHRHFDDPRFHHSHMLCDDYLFPGTAEEAQAVLLAFESGQTDILLPFHGSIAIRDIKESNWEKYNELFPPRYLGDKPEVKDAIDKAEEEIEEPLKESETLEVGCGKQALTKYAYDPYVTAENAEMLTWEEIESKSDNYFELVLLRNSIAYLDPEQIQLLVKKSKRFIANSFAEPKPLMLRDNECSCVVNDMVEHTLLLNDDSLMCHAFHAYNENSYKDMGFDTKIYGKNSVLITFGLDKE